MADDSSISSHDDDDSSVDHQDRNKRRKDRKSSSKHEKKTKKKKKRKKAKDKHHKKSSKRKRSNNEREDAFNSASYRLADALCTLLDKIPAMAEDLPAIFVQLANGTTMNLSNSPLREYLSKIFMELKPYGVVVASPDVYGFESLGGGTRDELVLVRVVRSMLDRIGVTLDAVALEHDNASPTAVREKVPQGQPKQHEENKNVERKTIQLIRDFGTSDLAKELMALCETILDGEVIALEGLPDERLRQALQLLFHDTCGMVPTELDDEDDDDDENTTVVGLGLPDDQVLVTQRVEIVRQTCMRQAERVMKGPLPRPVDDSDDDEDEDGPLLPGQTRMTFGTASAPAVPIVGSEGGREEWMLVPGKFDLLTGLKSGQPIRNRQFSGKRKDDTIEPKVDPKIEEEIRHLREVHEASRGPSLMEEHRKRKQREAAQKKSGNVDWKWDRSADLDAGRRVDKDALKMMLGGANTNLKGKFHSSL